MAEKRPSPKYTPEDIERGLFALAVCGNAAAAARQLAAQGHKVPRQTLQDWKAAHADRYHAISNNHIQQIREVIAAEQREIARAAGEAEREAIAKARVQLKDGRIRDASTAARNFSVTKGIALDHALKQAGEPMVIHQHNLQADDVLERIKKLAPTLFTIVGEAEEIRSAGLPKRAAQ
jgi:hypothetical protein